MKLRTFLFLSHYNEIWNEKRKNQNIVNYPKLKDKEFFLGEWRSTTNNTKKPHFFLFCVWFFSENNNKGASFFWKFWGFGTVGWVAQFFILVGGEIIDIV